MSAKLHSDNSSGYGNRPRKTSDDFDPGIFAVIRASSVDPDEEFMSAAVKIPATAQPALPRQPYIPAIPKSFLRVAAPAGDAIELLLIALAEMRMQGTKQVAIGPRLWVQVGDPTKRVRTRLLRQIGGLPPSLCTLTARVGRPHLLVSGPDWPQAVKPVSRT